MVDGRQEQILFKIKNAKYKINVHRFILKRLLITEKKKSNDYFQLRYYKTL